MPDPLTLAHEHRIRQVQGAVVVQKALDDTFTRTIDPVDLDRSFQIYLRAALAVLSVGRRSAAKTALSYYGDAQEAAEIRRLIPDLDLPPLNVKAATTSLLVTGPIAVKKQLSTGRSLDAAIAEARRQTMNYGKRATLNGGREALIGAVRMDSQARGWARVSDGQPCAFCAMLVSRGPVYKRQTVDFKSHDGCGCGVRPFFEGEADGGWSPDARALRDLWDRVDPKDWRSAYQAAADDPTTAVGAAFTSKVGARIALDVTREAREFAEAQARAQIVVAPAEEAWLAAWRETVKDIPDPDKRDDLGYRVTTPEERDRKIEEALEPATRNLRKLEYDLARVEDVIAVARLDIDANSLDPSRRLLSTVQGLKMRIGTKGKSTAEIYRALVEKRDRIQESVYKQQGAILDARYKLQTQIRAGKTLDVDPDTGELSGDLATHLDSILRAGQILEEEIERRVEVRLARDGITKPDAAAIEEAFYQAKRDLWDYRYDVEEAAKALQVKKYGSDEDKWPWQAWEAVSNAKSLAEVDDPKMKRLVDDLAKKEHAFRTVGADLEHYRKKAAEAWGEEAKAALAKVRPMGGKEQAYKVLPNTSPKDADDLLRAMRRAETAYPTDWLERNAKRVARAELGVERRGYNAGQGAKIVLSRKADDPDMYGVAAHELGHSMEVSVPGLSKFEFAYLYRRVTATQRGQKALGKPERIYSWTDQEIGWKDEFANHYTGKTYAHDKRGNMKYPMFYPTPLDADAWEVFTTGVESLFEGSPYFDRPEPLGFDHEFRRFMLGVISAL